MIICAAIKIKFVNSNDDVKELVVSGLRHGDCWEIIRHLDNKHTQWTEEGFIDNNGKFFNREEALEHATKYGQLTMTTRWHKLDHNERELYSEDLY